MGTGHRRLLFLAAALLVGASYLLFGSWWRPGSDGTTRAGARDPLSEYGPTLGATAAPPKAPDGIDAEREAARTLYEALKDATFEERKAMLFDRANSQQLGHVPFSEELVRLILRILLSSGPTEIWMPNGWLHALGPRAAPFVVEALAGEATEAQRGALLADLHGWHRQGATFEHPDYVPFLADGSYVMWSAMGIIKDGVPFEPRLADRLLELLRERPSDVKAGMGVALARMGPKGVALLADLAASGVLKERVGALEALSNAAPDDLRPHLDALAATIANAEEAAVVRIAAIRALRAMRGDCTACLPALRTALADEQYDYITSCLIVLDQMGARAAPAVPDLLRWLRESDARVSDKTAVTLGVIGARPDLVLPELERLLGERASDDVARALGAFGKAALPHALRVLEEGDEYARYAILWAFAKMGADAAPAVPKLVTLVNGPDDDVALRAVGTLGFVGESAAAAVPTIMARLAQGEGALPARVAAGTLANLGPSAEEALRGALTSKDATTRRQAIRVLSRFHARSAFALDELESLTAIRDLQARADVYQAIAVSLYDPRTPGVLYAAAKDPETVARVRRLLAQGVEEKDRTVSERARNYLAMVDLYVPAAR